MKHQPQKHEMRNLMLAILLSVGILFVWQVKYEQPRRQQLWEQEQSRQQAQLKKETEAAVKAAETSGVSNDILVYKPRAELVAQDVRLPIASPELAGSINLKGARLDDLTLTAYRETVKKDSNPVTLLSPSQADVGYFAETGWLAADNTTKVPDTGTVWKADAEKLEVGKPVTLSWENGSGIRFEQIITLDEHYMFTVEQRVVNQSESAVKLFPYGMINRVWAKQGKADLLLHEGAVSALNQEGLKDISYKDMREKGDTTQDNAKGWFGFNDKYWLTALIPDANITFKAKFSHYKQVMRDRYQADFAGSQVDVKAGETFTATHHVYAGAKRVKLLDAYTAQYQIPLFDRAVNFGFLYFLAKPMFEALHYFHALVGNFGVAILLLTVCIRILLYPLASKSFRSMGRMKDLMPKMEELKQRYGNDKLKLNQEMMELYKREKVNPMSGCLPLLLQMPVFFALYRVLYTSIEMRHAPFFGWIQDLSAADPSNLFTLFGLIQWAPPSFLHLGVLPILMCLTMVIQQRLNPKPTDPMQAMMMNYMPYLFLFLFANFPAGLVIYWAWNNILSILQQWYITRKHGPVKK